MLQDTDVNARPIIRADCIKFVHTFRNQFTVEQLLALIPVLIAHLGSEHVSLTGCCKGSWFLRWKRRFERGGPAVYLRYHGFVLFLLI